MLRRYGDQSDIDAISFISLSLVMYAFVRFSYFFFPFENLKSTEYITGYVVWCQNHFSKFLINSNSNRISIATCSQFNCHSVSLMQLKLPNNNVSWIWLLARKKERERKSIKKNLLRLISIIFVHIFNSFHFTIRYPLQWNTSCMMKLCGHKHQSPSIESKQYCCLCYVILCAIVCWWFELRL